MSRLRLTAAVAAAATVTACGAGEATPDNGCDPSDSAWIYAVDTELRQLDLFVYRDGEHVQLTDDHASSSPSLSPDGETIVFERGTGTWSECCGFDDHELWTVNVDGTNAEPLITDGSPRAPSWSPDGENIAYVDTVDDSGEAEIAVFNPSTGEHRTVGQSPVFWTVQPMWSPNGEELAWIDGESNTLFRLDLASGETNEQDIIADQELYPRGPLAWTPDGATILFSAIVGEGLEDSKPWLHRLDPESGEATPIAEDIQLPTVLPDGRIAGVIIDREAEQSDLVLLSPDGSNPQTITTLPIWFPYHGTRIVPLETC